MTRILVTGGAGYIGSHTCKALAQAGYTPICFDNLERGHGWAVKWGPLEKGDLRNQSDVDRAFAKWRPSAVIHFAAYAYVAESTVDPIKYYHNNVGGSVNLIRACSESDCKRIVFSSSCATYGVPLRLPLTEDHNQNPVSPYGFTKLVVERMLRESEIASGLKHVSLRYFNAAGADPDGELGELHRPETHLIPLILLAALGKEQSVKIFGDDYPTPDGTCIRDYIHVCDLADAHVAAIRWLSKNKPSRPFNLGNGRGFSVAEVIRKSREITGQPLKIEVEPRRDGDPPILISDSNDARTLLDWCPKVPSLDQQILHAWKWFRDELPKFQ